MSEDRVDWWSVVCDLERRGLRHAAIARRVGVSRQAVVAWKNEGKEPGYHAGCRLVDLWMSTVSDGLLSHQSSNTS